MIKRILICIFIYFIVAGFAVAEEELSLLLPKAEEIIPWKIAGEPLFYQGEYLYDFIDGGAEIFLEYGFRQVLSQEYQLGDYNLMVNIYQMDGNIAAFGIFSNNTSTRFKSIDLGNGGFQTEFSVNFWQAEYFITIESFQAEPSVSEALLKFASLISKRIGKRSEPLEVLNLLPSKNLIAGNLKLVKGILGINNTYYLSEKDIFMLRDRGLGLFADYLIDEQQIKLFLVQYKSPASSDSAFRRVQEFFNSKTDYKALESVQGILFWEKGDQYFSAINKGSILAVVLGAKNREDALGLLQLIK